MFLGLCISVYVISWRFRKAVNPNGRHININKISNQKRPGDQPTETEIRHRVEPFSDFQYYNRSLHYPPLKAPLSFSLRTPLLDDPGADTIAYQFSDCDPLSAKFTMASKSQPLLCWTVCAYRKPGLSEEEYHKHMSEIHGPLVKDLLVKYGFVRFSMVRGESKKFQVRFFRQLICN